MKIHNVDLSLYEKCRSGDSDAIAEVINTYGDPLVLFINGYVDNVVTAEKLMEEADCDMVMSRHCYRGKSSLKTYLFSTGRNKAMNHLRGSAKYGIDPIEHRASYLHDKYTLEDTVIKYERHRELWRAMEELRESHRTLLYLL